MKQQQQRVFVTFMAAMMVWLSLWTSACLAMGVAQASMPSSMGCHCPFADGQGGMVANCAVADGLGTYLHATPASIRAPVFVALPAAPMEQPLPTQQAVILQPSIDTSPPHSRRSLNIRYCVFLI
ncbi:MAG TPA: hypothetical protein VGO35_02460 [Gammaproteobacteria bacterium]|jgi:hypothetical protein|nr:hypothetical protein [Gammaproteobacteria bacterium]